jgi:hypothetical protein
MATTFTRSHGANARSYDWGRPHEEDEPRTGHWLPLDALTDEELFEGTPQLHAMPAPAPRRQQPPARQKPSPAPVPIKPTAPHPQPGRKAAQAGEQAAAPGVPVRLVAMLAGGAIVLLGVYVLVSMAVEWARITLDDIQYGRPRTMQVDAYVGHGEAEGMPSHFIAMNLNRRVIIMEMPGGDPTKATAIVGPYLFGQGEDLTPVQLDVHDVNADSKPDLVVSVKSEQLIYLNDGAAFRLITPEERAALQKALPLQSQEQGKTNPGGDTNNTNNGVEEGGK